MNSSKTPFFQSLASRTWMWRTGRIRWLGHVERITGWIAEVSKLNVVAQKRRSRPTRICDEVLVDDRKKLGPDCAVRCLRTMVPSFSIQ